MSTQYSVTVQETEIDLTSLSSNNYNLNVAMSVAGSDGKATYSVIYKSAEITFNMQITWTTNYALNWTNKMPAQGADVTYSGEWQECTLGQSFDLDSVGAWIPNQDNPHANTTALNIGSNGFNAPVHVIVGVQDPETNAWSPIWVASDALLKEGFGAFTPLQSVKVWYQEDTKSATMIGDQSTPIETYDMSPTPSIYFSFVASEGKWQIPQITPFYKD